MFYEELLQYTEDAGEIFASYYKALAYTNVANESARYYTIANEGVIDAIKSFFSRIWEFIKSAIGKFWEFIKSVFNKIASIFSSKAEKINKANEAKAKFIEAEKKLSDSLSQGKVNLSGAQQAVDETKKAAEEMLKNTDKVKEEIKERHEKFNKRLDETLNGIKKSINEAKENHADAQENLAKIKEKLDNHIKKVDRTYFICPLDNPGEELKNSFGMLFDKAWRRDSDNISNKLNDALHNIYYDNPKKSDEYLDTFKGWFKEIVIHESIDNICDPVRNVYDSIKRSIKIKSFDNYKDYKNFHDKYISSTATSLRAICKLLNGNLDTLKPFESIKKVEAEVNKILSTGETLSYKNGPVHESVKNSIPIAFISKIYSNLVKIYTECTNIALKEYKTFSGYFMDMLNDSHSDESLSKSSLSYYIKDVEERSRNFEVKALEIRRKYSLSNE